MISFENFLKYAFGLPDDWEARLNNQLRAALEIKEFEDYFQTCEKEKGKKEDVLYEPFACLCNQALYIILEKHPELVLYQQDPEIIRGPSAARRKPDLGIISLDLLREFSKDYATKFPWYSMKNDFKNCRVTWANLLHFVEMKHKRGRTLERANIARADLSQTTEKSKISNEASKGSSKPGQTPQPRSSHNVHSMELRPKKRNPPVPSQPLKEALLGEAFEQLHIGSGRQSDREPVSDKNKDPKPTVADFRKDVHLQCAGYGLEMLSNGRFRGHTIGMLVDDQEVQMVYYDHSAIVLSEPLHISKNKKLFLAMLLCLHGLTPKERGNLQQPELEKIEEEQLEKKMAEEQKENERKKKEQKEKQEGEEEAEPPDPLVEYTMKLENGKVIRLTRVIFRSRGIIGRGTIVAEAECLCVGTPCREASGCSWKGDNFVVKISFPSKTREAENDLINRALEMASGGHEWVKKHLPVVMHAEKHGWDADPVQHRFAQYLQAHFELEYEERVMRIVVQKKLHPLRELRSVDELAQVFLDVLQCHRWLYVYPRILHRDISSNNIMFCRDESDAVYGVVIDFDLSSTVENNRMASSRQRTGTRPYMAYDLFNPRWTRGHFYRHDLESLFYVALCTACRHGTLELQLIPEPPYQFWFTEEPRRVREGKGIEVIFNHEFDASTTDYFADFKPWLMSLQMMISLGHLHRGVALRSKGVFDEDTLGGKVTYANFVSTMSEFGGKKLALRTSDVMDDKQEALNTAATA